MVATANILLIGAELLRGEVEDKNGIYVLQKLQQRGIRCHQLRIVDDQVDDIALHINQLRHNADALFTIGGIGPTHDDVTFAAVAQALGVTLHLHPTLQQDRRYRHGDPIYEKLATLPMGTQVTRSPHGSYLFKVENVYVLPGIPAMLRQDIDCILQQLPTQPLWHQEILWIAHEETVIAQPLQQVASQFAHVVDIGSYPVGSQSQPKTKLTIQSKDARKLAECVNRLNQLFAHLMMDTQT